MFLFTQKIGIDSAPTSAFYHADSTGKRAYKALSRTGGPPVFFLNESTKAPLDNPLYDPKESPRCMTTEAAELPDSWSD